MMAAKAPKVAKKVVKKAAPKKVAPKKVAPKKVVKKAAPKKAAPKPPPKTLASRVPVKRSQIKSSGKTTSDFKATRKFADRGSSFSLQQMFGFSVKKDASGGTPAGGRSKFKPGAYYTTK